MPRGYKILIADDEPGIRELLGDLLKSYFDVDTVDRGDLILDRLGRFNHDILILDLHLPGMNGLDVLGRIHESKMKVMVVVLTASSDLATAVTSMKLGAYEYIVKPFDNDKLMVILKNIVEKLELEKEVTELTRTAPSSSSARAERARRSSPRPFITTATGASTLSGPSTAAPSRAISSGASSLATRRAPSRARSRAR